MPFTELLTADQLGLMSKYPVSDKFNMTKSGRAIILLSLFFFCLGILAGAYLFSGTQRRSVLALGDCEDCMSLKDLAGMMASLGIHVAPGILPFVYLETDKSIAFKLPTDKGHFHFVIVPKKDIKNIGQSSDGDPSYISDILSVTRYIIEKEKLAN